MTASSENILAYEAADFVEAHALAAHLEAAGVEVRVTGDALQGAYGSVGTSSLGDAEVWIAAADRETAEPLIAAWRAEHQPGEPIRQGRFQFSTVTLFVLLAVVALLAGTFMMEGDSLDAFTATVGIGSTLLFLIGIFVVLIRRRR